jgi:spore coat polysaccharide biosynthesis protein SpsF
MHVSIRPVVEKDLRIILEWRNDPETRKNSFNASEISWEDHVSYWKKRLSDKTRYSFIVTSECVALGLVRLDPTDKNGEFEIHILISKENRGKGMGTKAINEAKEFLSSKGKGRIIANVKKSNIASMKMFLECGFSKLQSSEHYDTYFIDL